MDKSRITIKDIADELGLSTATVSNVIHGKTKKISVQTVSKVQEKLEESGYIPNMAAVLLAQNTSRIVCVVLSDDPKYEHKMLQDPFVNGIVNTISRELSAKGYFMMLKEEPDVNQIVRYASMWNMAGLILIGFCSVDYANLRKQMHIPFVVVDSYEKEVHNYSDIGIDNIKGGFIAGEYLIANGHTKIMYIADNDEDCDHDRYVGLTNALSSHNIEYSASDFKLLSIDHTVRFARYDEILLDIKNYTAAFCASDVYAIEFMNYLSDNNVNVPEDISVIGFDNIPMAANIRPALTTISQDLNRRGVTSVQMLEELINGSGAPHSVLLPVELIERDSVKRIN